MSRRTRLHCHHRYEDGKCRKCGHREVPKCEVCGDPVAVNGNGKLCIRHRNEPTDAYIDKLLLEVRARVAGANLG